MAEVAPDLKELSLTLGYFGPPSAGKSSNVRRLHDRLPAGVRSKLKHVEVRGDSTLSFEICLALTTPPGWTLRVELAALTGDLKGSASQRALLGRADALVFVAFAAENRQNENRESWAALSGALVGVQDPVARAPKVIQFNRTDDPGALGEDELARAWADTEAPMFTARAKTTHGVLETFTCALQLACERLVGVAASHSAAPGITIEGLLSPMRSALREPT